MNEDEEESELLAQVIRELGERVELYRRALAVTDTKERIVILRKLVSHE